MIESAVDMRVGLFEVGLNTYWNQFEGLLDRLVEYRKDISGKIGRMDVRVVDAGMVDNPEKALQAADLFKKEGVEIIFLFISNLCTLFDGASCCQKSRHSCYHS